MNRPKNFIPNPTRQAPLSKRAKQLLRRHFKDKKENGLSKNASEKALFATLGYDNADEAYKGMVIDKQRIYPEPQ